VSENKAYASILIHQERGYPGRAVGTQFVNPDLDLIGKAYGFAVTRIFSVSQFEKLSAALRAPGPQFIVVNTSIKAVLPKPAPVRAAAE